MIYENEIIMLVLGLGVLVLALSNRDHLKRVPLFKVLFTGFCILIVSWIVTVLEDLFPEDTLGNSSLNFLEHLCYAASGLLVALWCWLVFRGVKEGE